MFSLCPTCHNTVAIKELILIYYGASCCFTVPHSRGLLLTGPPLNGIGLLVFNACVVCTKSCWLKPGCLSYDQMADQEVVWKQGQIKKCHMKVFQHLSWWFLHTHQPWIAQKLCRNISFIYVELLILFRHFCWAHSTLQQ